MSPIREPSVRRRTTLALLFAATTISYVDRHTLSVVAPIIRAEFDISNSGYATIVSSFLVAYTLMQPVTGSLVDRLGARRGFGLVMLWWSLAAVLHALGKGVLSFSVLRFLLGSGQAGSWAASVKTVTEHFPRGQRGTANGIWGAGTSVGLVLAVPLAAWLTASFGWRWAFILTGITGLVWLPFWTKSFSTSLKTAPSGGVAASAPRFRSLLASRSVWAVILARVLADPTAWFYHFWLPSYLSDERGFNLQEIGLVGWIPFLTQAIGIVAGGMLSDRLYRKGGALIGARLWVMLAGVVLMTSAISAAFSFHIAITLAAISLATFGFGLWAPNMMSICGEAFPRQAIGSVTGLSGFGAGIGAIALTQLTGLLVDHVGYAPVFVLAGVMPLAAFALLFALLERKVRA